MRRLAIFVGLTLFPAAILPAADPQLMAAETTTAMTLVRRALDADLAGQRADRKAFLRQALELAPMYAPARWHNGELLGEGWQPLRDVQAVYSGDRHLKEYRQLRDSADDSVAAHTALARFCRRQQWQDRETFHWHSVLRLQPRNREAIDALSLQEHHGMWFTPEDLARYKRLTQQTQENLKHWQPIFERWREEIEGSDAVKCEAALAQLAAVRDIGALPALSRTLSKGNASFCLAAIAALSKVNESAATEILVWQSVSSTHEAVRLAAIMALKERPWHAYVPMLMGSLNSPLEFTSTQARRPTGVYFNRLQLTRDTPLAENSITNIFGGRITFHHVLASRAQAANEVTKWQNERIFFVLEKTTNQKLPRVPQAWWEWWTAYNELYICKSKSIRVQYRPMSCFAPGTLVWTETGLEPIERLRPGDRVLSQHSNTGELAFRVIRETTLRPASPTLRIQLNNETIIATRGHPFWVCGDGWRMAKQLTSEDRLYSLEGSLPIEQVEVGPAWEAHNLVVDGFGTYFVGKAGLLVRDNHLGEVLKTPLPGYRVVANSPQEGE